MAVVLTKPVSLISLEEPEPYTHEQFKALTADYPDLRMEHTAQGEIIIMPPTFSGTGRRNFKLTGQLAIWTMQDGTGEGFDSNTGFRLPNGATRAPDASWILKSRWEAVPVNSREEEFAPICPDFVVELRSKTDRLSKLQEKMREYITNGARLGWLLDPKNKYVEIYRPGRDVEVLDNPETLSGEEVLPGFMLKIAEIFA